MEAGVGGGVYESTAAHRDSVAATCMTELFGIRIGIWAGLGVAAVAWNDVTEEKEAANHR